MYRPNFCAECGARVEREHWGWWTSGRFCAACDARFRLRRLLLPALSCALMLSVGFVAGRRLRPTGAPPPLVVRRAETHALANDAAQGRAANIASDAQRREPSDGAGGAGVERPTDPAEVVSMCGARTKKGTPCTRRVRGTGRCWQHRGRPAMLPPSKLIVPG